MLEQVFEAKSNYYFQSKDCPIAVMKVAAGSSVQHPHDLTADLHSHSFSELVIITRGEGIQVIDSVEYLVKQGDVFFIEGECAHYFKDRKTVSLVNVAFSPHELPLPYNWLRRLPNYNHIFELEPSLRKSSGASERLVLHSSDLEKALKIVEELEAKLSDNSTGFEIDVFQKLLELIVFVSRYCNAPFSDNQGALLRVGKIIGLLEREFVRDWTLKELAHRAASSPNNLLRNFRSATGTSPIDYLIQVRLKHGADMLKNSGKTVTTIANECGFKDSNYFTRKFHAVYGITPRNYRKRA